MYTQFFNLREMPFSIAPDPAYLYMSPRHQEALGHLLYGTGKYGGFVQLTGEVGTGKTTIIRTLLAQRLDNVDVAMIHNPRQSEREFVQSICDELGVDYDKANPTLKTLVDALNQYLVARHAEGRRTVLIIDEAQQLAPDVLEQVRLLTNLETSKEKLLRIMLVGQPELAELLGRQDLRQLAQRITARYHLTPLSADETSEYIAHRLQVAGGARDIFTPAAVKRVHKYAGGIPRLVNVLCDRALLGAYAKSQRQVGPELVELAAEEVFGTQVPRAAPVAASSVAVPRRARDDSGTRAAARLRSILWPWLAVPLIGLVAAFVGLQVWRALPRDAAAETAASAESVPGAETSPASASAEPRAETAASVPPATPEPAAAKPAAAAQPALTAQLDAATSGLNAQVLKLAQLWQPGWKPSVGERFCLALHRDRLECLKGNAEWSDLAAMNLPAVLTLSIHGNLRYVLLLQLSHDNATLQTSKGGLQLPLTQLDPLWTGEYLALWRRETDETTIGPDTRGEPVQWLRQRLQARLGTPVGNPDDPLWDEELRKAVGRVQTVIGLKPDGVAGPRTLVALASKPGPQLAARRGAKAEGSP